MSKVVRLLPSRQILVGSSALVSTPSRISILIGLIDRSAGNLYEDISLQETEGSSAEGEPSLALNAMSPDLKEINMMVGVLSAPNVTSRLAAFSKLCCEGGTYPRRCKVQLDFVLLETSNRRAYDHLDQGSRFPNPCCC